MRDQVEQRCEDHPDPFDCADNIIVRASDGSYGLPIHDGGSSYIEIRFCPWCGSRLPGEPSTAPNRLIDLD
jgi:hypothetical protein